MTWRRQWAGYLKAVMSAEDVDRVAATTGIDAEELRGWLVGRGRGDRPDIDTLRRLAATLDVEVIELVVATGHLTWQEAWPQPLQRRRAEPLIVPVPAPDLFSQLWPCALLRRLRRWVASVP